MPVNIALLRGINVTGNNIIKMEDLRALCTKLKWEGAQTFIQSGNIVFRSAESDPAALAKKLGDAIENKYSFRPEVMIRTLDELRAVVASHPFRKRRDLDPAKFAVFFLTSEPTAEIQSKLNEAEKIEELHFKGRELYIYFPNGQGRSEFAPILGRILKKTSTARNWNTTLKLLTMAEALESGTQ